MGKFQRGSYIVTLLLILMILGKLFNLQTSLSLTITQLQKYLLDEIFMFFKWNNEAEMPGMYHLIDVSNFPSPVSSSLPLFMPPHCSWWISALFHTLRR